MELPIRSRLGEIVAALKGARRLILSSAPGSGKTSCVPPELLELTSGKVLLVEPRRVAARAAAARIAALRGEKVGSVVGYRVRGDRAESSATRLLAVTPGVFLNLLQSDPLLESVGAVILDEFHERQWELDLALALIDDLERSVGARLYVVVMSATADTERLAAYLPGAQALHVPGRLHDVDVRWSDDAPVSAPSAAAECAKTLLRARRETSGDVLAFLPGTGEIAAAHELLRDALDPEHETLLELHGNLPLAEQTSALAPDPRGRRKIVLATNVAESSLTIDGVTGVVDSGLERRMEYDPDAGMSFLKVVKITRASAEQRAGRAGRTAPGVVWRLWSRFDHAARAPFTVPEILRCELARPLLEILAWGSTPERLRWLDPPPEAALSEARKLLRRLGAVDGDGKLSPRGRRLAALPVHPRLGAMLLRAEELGALDTAIDLAARLEERTPPARTAEVTEIPRSRDAAVIKNELRALFRRSRKTSDGNVSPGVLLATAFPEWIARRRGAAGTTYHLAGGFDARLRPGDDLERCEFLAVARLGGSGTSARTIQLAAPLDREELETRFADAVTTETRVVFNPDTGRASVRSERRLGDLILSEGAAGAADPAAVAAAVVAFARERDLEIPPRGDDAARRLLDRVRFAHRLDPGHYPDWNGDAWKELWSRFAAASPIRGIAELEKLPWLEMMRAELGRDTLKRLDREYPPAFRPPRGNEIKIDYSQEVPTLPVRIQALYTLDAHPCVGTAKLPLKLELLSPANRPVQLTSDLPGFWRGTWKLVRKEMKSRYPKHSWPEDPLRPDD